MKQKVNAHVILRLEGLSNISAGLSSKAPAEGPEYHV